MIATIILTLIGVIVVGIAVLVNVRPWRQALISRRVFATYRRILPKMSDTEREALEAGTVAGALYDFGVAARPADFYWRAWVVFATTPVVGEVIRLYWKTSDGINPDNDDGTGDAAVSAEDKLRNLKYIDELTVDEASSTPTFVASGYLPKRIAAARYGAPVFWNATADALSATAGDHGFSITPVPDEMQ